MRDLLRDRRVWVGIGTVMKRQDEDSHWRFAEDENGNKVDVLVECDLHPGPIPVECRLASVGGGPGHGLWKVPPVGTQVVIVVQRGELEADCSIVGTLASNQAPDAALLDDDTLVLLNPKNIVVQSDTGDVNITATQGGVNVKAHGDVKVDADGKVEIQTAGGGAHKIARDTDPIDAGTLVVAFVPGSGGAALAVSHLAPGSPTPPVPGTTYVSLTGKVTDGSSKADCG
jgi:hypothetical protein